MTKYRRKKFFFKTGPQGKYIFSYFVIAGLVTTIFTILLLYFSSNTLSITYTNNDLQLGSTPEILLDMLLGIHGLLILIFGLFIIYFATRFTHRFIGPIFKIESTIEKMIEGDINVQITLRHKDDCKELAEKLNMFSFSLYSRLKTVKTLSNSIKEITASQDTSDGSNTAIQLSHIKSLCDELDSTLSHFNLSGDLPEEP